MPNPGYWEIRLWNADNTAWRVLPRRLVLLSPTPVFRRVREGGFVDASFALTGKLSDRALSGVVFGRRMELWGADTTGTLILLYRGYIDDLKPVRSGKLRQVQVSLGGIWLQIKRLIVRQRYALPFDLDCALLWQRIVTKWVQGNPSYAGVVVEASPTGQTIDYLDAHRKSIGELSSNLIETVGGFATVGCDVDADGNDRLYFRPFGSSVAPRYTIPLPPPLGASWGVESYEPEEDGRDVTNVFDVAGGRSVWVNKMAQSTQGNTSLEFPTLGTEAGVNAVIDPGFEGRASEWNLINGATYKVGGLSEGPTDGGDDMVLLDAVNEGVYQDLDFAFASPVVPFHDYDFQVRARLTDGGDVGATAVLTIIWKNGAFATLQTDTLTIAPTLAVWDTYTLTSRAPAGATNARMSLALTVDVGDGIVTDNWAAYDRSMVYARGLEAYPNPTGTGEVLVVNWNDETDSWHGAYSLYIEVEAADSDGNDVSIRAANHAKFDVSGNETLTASVRVKPVPGKTMPLLQLQMIDFAGEQVLGKGISYFASSDGTPSGAAAIDSAENSVDANGWRRYAITKTLGGTATQAAFCVVPRSDGAFRMDALLVTNPNAPDDFFIEGETYEGVFRAEDLVGSGPVHDSNDDYGDRPELIDNENITTDADAERLATANATTKATPKKKPLIRIVGRAWDMVLGEYVRGVGEGATETLPDPLPVCETEIVIDRGGVLSLVPYLGEERASESRIARKIAREQARKQGRSQGNSFASSPSAGGGGGSSESGSLDLPLTVANGGTSATTAAAARDALFEATLVTGVITIPLAKITNLGTDGYIELTNAGVTDFLLPT